MTGKRSTTGFTITELMLAMTFIAFLLLFVVGAIMQVTRLYVKGQAMRQINQTGRQVVTDLAARMRYAVPSYVTANNRLCLEGVSYVWNIQGSSTNKFAVPDQAIPLNFVSVNDPLGVLCSEPTTDVNKAMSKDLIGPEVTPVRFTLTQRGKLWDISLLLSTSGDNVVRAGGPAGFQCDPTNQFCAFGDFTTTIYARKQ